jgi:hypothetical protein
VEGSTLEKMLEDCGVTFEAEPNGKYLLSWTGGEKRGIYFVSIAERTCAMLVPGAATFGINGEKDGKSFLYATPFAFPLTSDGNAYDFSRDLTTVVYARPGGHADLYLLSEK